MGKGIEESGENYFSVISMADLLLGAEIHLRRGRSVSRACSGTAQNCQPGYHLEIK